MEFTEDDDEQLCHYIAEVLPEKDEGGRTGHFIYTDLMRRVSTTSLLIYISLISVAFSPFRLTNLGNTTGRNATPKMLGASAIAKIRFAWTEGSPKSSMRTPRRLTGRGNTATGGSGGLMRTPRNMGWTPKPRQTTNRRRTAMMTWF
jgi:hypothetical protein